MIKKLLLSLFILITVSTHVYPAVEFDSVNDLINCGSDASLDNLEAQGNGGLTISAWVYPRSGGASSVGGIWSKADTGPDSGHLRFLMSTGTNAGEIRFIRNFTVLSLDAESVAGAAPNNVWSHVAMTWPGSALASSVTFYSGGSVVAHSSDTNGGVVVSDAALPAVIGNISNGTRGFDGFISDIAVWNAVLTQDDIRRLATKVKGMPLQVKSQFLKGYWPLDECLNGTGCGGTNQFKDRSLSKVNTGTASNSPKGKGEFFLSYI